MSWKASLLATRSYITILLGFLIGFSIVLYVEKHMSPVVEEKAGYTLSRDFPPLPQRRDLTFDEAVWARVAWQYFVNNTQLTGLANAQDQRPYTSLWDTGSYLMALIAARQLDIVPVDEFDQRISKTLTALSLLPLLPNGVPGSWYNTQTLSMMVDPEQQEPPTGSAVDMGRLLVPLTLLVWRYPTHAAQVQEVLDQWNLNALFESNSPATATSIEVSHWDLSASQTRSGYGFRLYTAGTLRMVSPSAGIAVTQPPEGVKLVQIDGYAIPSDGFRKGVDQDAPTIITLPYVLTGLELGFDSRSAEFAWRIVRIQQSLHKATGNYTSVNTDYAEQAPDFIAALPGQQPVQDATVSRSDQEPARLLSTRSAFGWYALFRNAWSESLRAQAAALLEPGKGWYEGTSGNQNVNQTLSADTNAVVLESLSYIAHGQMLCLACVSRSTMPMTDRNKGVLP